MYFCTAFKRDNLSKKAAPKSQRGVTVRVSIYHLLRISSWSGFVELPAFWLALCEG